MSGGRATFSLKRGTRVTKAQVVAALSAKKLKLEAFRHEIRPRPAASFVATVTGLG